MCPQDCWTQDTLELVAHHLASCRIACTQTLSDQGGRRKGEWHLGIFAFPPLEDKPISSPIVHSIYGQGHT